MPDPISLWQAIILGLVQGATEFIPVSSSGHLVLVPWLLGWSEPGLVFDTLAHWGTLVAVLAFFWRDWWRLITAWLRGLVRWQWTDPDARLMWLLIAGTIPAAVIGYFLEKPLEALFGQPAWVSLFLLVTAVVLALGEWLGRRARALVDLNLPDALLVGLGQAAAIAPGLSRSGTTMTVGMWRGLKREAAARFSFLLSTPIILGAGFFKLLDLLDVSNPLAQAPALAAGFLAAAVSGYLCIWALLRYLQRGKLYPFAVYCALAGILCLVIAVLR